MQTRATFTIYKKQKFTFSRAAAQISTAQSQRLILVTWPMVLHGARAELDVFLPHLGTKGDGMQEC